MARVIVARKTVLLEYRETEVQHFPLSLMELTAVEGRQARPGQISYPRKRLHALRSHVALINKKQRTKEVK